MKCEIFSYRALEVIIVQIKTISERYRKSLIFVSSKLVCEKIDKKENKQVLRREGFWKTRFKDCCHTQS